MQPKISIIIPTYNSAKTIIKCLESITAQFCQDFEVLIIDRLSTDNTLKIIEKFQSTNPNIKYISEEDNGIYDAMNKGINLSIGEWLYFLGSDDTFYDNSVLSSIIKKIGECKDKVIYGNVIMRGINQWNVNNVVFNGEYQLEKMITTNICHQAIFYHKTVFKLYGNYNLNYITGADQDFNLRCYANTSFSYINLIVANFLLGGHSTKVYDRKFNDDRGALLLKYFGNRVFSKPFINSRLYFREGALSSKSHLLIHERLYCIFAYIKLKLHSVVIKTSKKSEDV